MSIAALIRSMAAAGAPPEAIALAVEAIEGAQALIEQKKAVERDRKRRQRERNKDGTVTGQSRDITGTVTDEPPAPKVSPQTPLPNPTPAKRDTLRARKGWACPEGVDPEHWRDFLANRRTKRLTDSPTAYRGQLKALDELSDDEWPPGRLVQFAAERGWGSINDPRNSPYGQPRKPHPQQGGDELLGALERARAEEAAEREAEADHSRTWGALSPEFSLHSGHA